jgi:hypothetical protein
MFSLMSGGTSYLDIGFLICQKKKKRRVARVIG